MTHFMNAVWFSRELKVVLVDEAVDFFLPGRK